MMLDLNDYYPASNLPNLLGLAASPAIVERAQAINNLVNIACEAACCARPTTSGRSRRCSGAAFDAGDAAKAEDSPPSWSVNHRRSGSSRRPLKP